MNTVQFVGGPMCGREHPWTTAKYVMIPDAGDMVSAWVPEWNEAVTLFGEHTYEMRCYRKGRRRKYQLEHIGYRPPTLGPGMVRLTWP